MATLAIGGFASASVPAEPTRIANNARMARGAITVTGTHLAWEGAATSGDDSEIFLADAALPVAESIGLCPLTNPCQLTDDAADDVAPLRSERWVVWQRTDLPAYDRSLWFSDGAQIAAVPGSATPVYYGNFVSVSGSRVVWRGADDAGTAGIFPIASSSATARKPPKPSATGPISPSRPMERGSRGRPSGVS